MTEELKRCPFDGGNPKIIYNHDLNIENLGDVRILCMKCLCGTYSHSFANKILKESQTILAIEAWNARV